MSGTSGPINFIGRGQMSVLEQHILHHRQIHHLYTEALKEVDGITVQQNHTSDFDSNFWLTTILIDEGIKIKEENYSYESYSTDCQPNANVEALISALAERGIESRPLWKPMHKQPLYANCPAYTDGTSEKLFKKGLCLPSGPCVSMEDAQWIVECIKEAIIK